MPPNGWRYPLVGGDEITPLCRNQLQTMQPACLHPVRAVGPSGRNGLAAGTGENAPTPTPCPGARLPRLLGAGVAGGRVRAVRCVSPFLYGFSMIG